MSLLDEIEASTRKPGIPCAVERLLNDLSAPDVADLRTALANADIPSSAIGRAVRARNHSCPDESLNRHRRGDCSCARS